MTIMWKKIKRTFMALYIKKVIFNTPNIVKNQN